MSLRACRDFEEGCAWQNTNTHTQQKLEKGSTFTVNESTSFTPSSTLDSFFSSASLKERETIKWGKCRFMYSRSDDFIRAKKKIKNFTHGLKNIKIHTDVQGGN